MFKSVLTASALALTMSVGGLAGSTPALAKGAQKLGSPNKVIGAKRGNRANRNRGQRTSANRGNRARVVVRNRSPRVVVRNRRGSRAIVRNRGPRIVLRTGRPHRYGRRYGYGPRICTANRALRKARNLGIRRAHIARVGRRAVVVRGFRRGPVRARFARYSRFCETLNVARLY